MDMDIKGITERVKTDSKLVENVLQQVRRVIVGQDYLVERLITALLSNAHVLIEGVPGLAKTLTVTTLARAIDASFQRIQFTPDLLPADLTGTMIYRPDTGTFTPHKGPLFANIVLADEINRAPAKVQSALLEAMQERQITIGEETFPMEDPFLVMATQNPIEQEGTYPLPEAQLDRFMMKLKVDYPDKKEERTILDRMGTINPETDVEAVLKPSDIVRLRETVDEIYVDDKIKDYIVDITHATRRPAEYGMEELEELIEYGASPRGTIYLVIGAKAHAFLDGRGYVTPQDVKSIAPDVLRHRVITSYEAEAEEIPPDDVIKKILDNIKVP